MRIVPVAISLLFLLSCGKGDAPKEDAGHEHPPAPHGGEVLELGDDYHLEMIHDHVGGNVTVFVLDKDAKTTLAVERPVIHLATKGGPVEVVLTAVDPKPNGTAESWKGSHEGLKADPWDGRIRIKLGDKTYQSALEGPAHSHE